MNEEAVRGLAQPDQRSCGPSSLVAARMLLDPEYAVRVRTDEDGFAREALELHRKVTGVAAPGGALQLPWPRALGTPPWAVAGQLSAYAGVRYRTRLARLGGRAGLVARMREAVAAGRPVPFYVGNRWLPRHVVLAIGETDDGLRVYNPARGTVVPMATTGFLGSTLPFGRWVTPWFVVLPDQP